MTDQTIYVDFAAATPTDPAVVTAMQPYWQEQFGNPSSGHRVGTQAHEAVLAAQETIAEFIGAKASEIFFTGSGTESNNLAILGVARANKNRGQHIITTKTEHLSILNACRALEKDGWTVTYLPVDRNGLITADELKKAITAETVLVATHYGNSELGICQNIEEISNIAHAAGALMHVDACQAAAYVPIDVAKMGIDLLTFNGSKMYGPKGVAALYVRDGVQIFPILYGGGQQQSLRSGTENVPGIVGLVKATEIAKDRFQSIEKIKQLRDELAQQLVGLGATINAQHPARLPNHLSVTFPQFAGANIVAAFDEHGIALSSGSACSSTTLTDSHVLSAIGLSSIAINRTVRISLGWPTTAADCKQIVSAVAEL
jgi:cysteine desulfurase